MSLLAYKEVYDPYHTIFRFFRLRLLVKEISNLHFDHLRILDYFLANPYRLEIMSFKSEHRSLRKVARKYSKNKPYSQLPDDFILFEYMRTSQIAAISSLSRNNYINAPQLTKDIVVFENITIPDAIGNLALNMNQNENDLCEVLTSLASQYKLLGPDGLKKRTGLMEYRNDFIQTNYDN